MLQIRLLGQFDVRLGGKRVVIPSRAGQSLLAYLSLTAGTAHRREKLAGLLWPDMSDESARKNLRHELWRLRKAIPGQHLTAADDYLLANEFTLTFNRHADYWLDVAILERPDLDPQSLTASLSLYQGDLLPGFYEEWIVLERERIQALFESKMERLVDQLLEAERWTAVQEQSERWLALGNTPEPAYRALMLSHSARGDMAKVSATYQRCVTDLQEQYGVEPSTETHALYNGLLKGARAPRRVVSTQPSGTVTFLFTDIQASTRLLEKLQDQYASALADHHKIVRTAIQKWNGSEMDTQGDAFFVTFTRTLDAVQCAAEAQRMLSAHSWPADEPVRVRMGLHTGEPLIASTGYVGMDVHRAARIGDAGHGGQVLLSQTTRDLVLQDLPPDLTIRDLGEHRLKDMKHPTPLYQLVIEGLSATFPPLRTKFTGTEAPTPGIPPFKGLQYFEERDTELFFGRELLTAKLINRLNGSRFLSVIIGASGSGKSSVVRAGLIPALKKGTVLLDGTKPPKDSTYWQIHINTPTAHPLQALAAELTQHSESVTATTTLMDDLMSDPRSLSLFLARKYPKTHTLLVIDQFEELFTLCRDEFEREAFIDNLLSAITAETSHVTVIIALRADFYAHLSQYPELRDAIARQQEYIGPMTTEELRHAIEEPAKRGHWEFEPGLVDLILRDVGDEPGALPLLSHALLETWKRRAGHTLTLKGYADAGGVRGAIANTAESVFQNLAPAEQVIARNVFLRLTELGKGTEDTRRRASFNELMLQDEDPGHVRSVLNILADARLITLSEDTAEVAHEALIREWPTLREWLNEDRQGLQLHRRLAESAREWELLEYDEGILYRGAQLAQVREWAYQQPKLLNTGERAFLEASDRLEKRELEKKEEARQRELTAAKELAEAQRQRAEQQTYAAKQLRQRALLLTGALVIAGLFALAAFVFGERAKTEAQLSSSRELAAAAISNLDIDPERSILLALEAVSAAHTLEAEDALHKAVATSRVQRTIDGHDAQIWSVAFSPDGTKLASASQDGTAKIWDPASGKELLVFQGHGVVGINSIAFSPDGNRVATADDNGRVKVWDAETGQELLTLSDQRSLVLDVVFSPDGKHLASARADRTAIVWDAWTGQKLFTLQGHTDELVHVFFSPDGNRLSTASLDETVKVWDAKTGEELLTVPGLAMALSPDGTRLATVSGNLVINIFDITSGDMLFRLRGHTNNLTSAAFSPDGRLLVTTSLDTKAIVWDVSTGLDLVTLSGHTEDVTTAAFSPDGVRLATASQDGIIKIWSLTPGHELPAILHPPGNTSWFALSPDGKHLVMIGESTAVPEVWSIAQKVDLSGNAEKPQRILTLDGHEDYVRALAYSPDGSRIATGSRDRTAKVWDAETGAELLTLTTPGGVAWVAFSPDGSRLATGGADGMTRIWSTETGENVSVLRGHHVAVLNVAFNPEGTRLAAGIDDEMARIWDMATCKQLFILSHPGAVYGIAFSPDGKRLATASSAGIIKVWDAHSGDELLSFTGHTDSIVSVSFSPDGTRLATASRDGTTKLWDAASGQELLTLQGSAVGVCCVAFSPEGTYLFTGGDDGVRVYALQMEDLVRLARSRLTRSLTTEECQKYLHVEACPNKP